MKQWHLLTYDVRDNKRLQRLHRYLKKHGLAVQNSIFLLHVTAAQLADILYAVRDIVQLRQDSVQLYPVADPAHIWAGGQQSMAAAGLFSGDVRAVTAPQLLFG